MVASNIKPEIEYNESKKINEEDKGHSTSVYEAEILEKRVAICIGKIKYTYTGKDVVYYLVYLIKDEVVKSQIGVLELRAKDLSNYMDNDDSIDIEKFAKDGNHFLLYGFVNKDYLELSKSDPSVFFLQKVSIDEPESKEFVEEEEKELNVLELQQKYNPLVKKREKTEEEITKDIFEKIENADIPELLKEETKTDADKLKNDSANSNWVQKFMKNDNFRVQTIPGDGDCFFTVIKEAFRQIGKKTTIEKLRNIVANSVNPELYDHYSAIYHGFLNEILENEAKIKKIKENIRQLREREKTITNKADAVQIVNQIDALIGDGKKFTKYIENANRDIGHYVFMEDVKSLDELRVKLRSSSYWADEFAISKLEEKLNIKMIIMSEENYKSGAEDQVMKCVTGTDQNIANPTPEFYIMTSYTGNHYNLISYKDKKILKFSEIPYYIKTLIVNKCIERNAGVFSHITDFRNFQTNFGIDAVNNSYLPELVQSDKFDDTIHFMFYNNSADAKPGKGNGEKIGKNDMLEFRDLQLVKDWRRKLDDEYVSPFLFANKNWQTVEHYYQASKFKNGFPDFYASFSLDSSSEISNDVKKAKAAGGKTGKYEKQLLRPKEVKLDSDFYGGRDKVERSNSVMAKFEQSPELKKMLLDTKKAKLLHFVRGSEPEIDDVLMEVRTKLKPSL